MQTGGDILKMKKEIDFKELSQINFPITSIVWISFLSSSLLIYVYSYLEQKNKFLFVSYVILFALTFLLLTIIYTCKVITLYTELQEKHRKKEIENYIINRTLSFIERWNNPDYLRFRRVANEIYQLFEKQPLDSRASFIIKHLENNTKERDDITILLNFLEEMSICVEEEVVKEKLLMKFFKGIVISYCEVYYPYIKERREKKGRSNLYKPLTSLCEKWENL